MVLPSSMTAQEGLRARDAAGDSLQRTNLASVLFERNQNTFNWTGRALIDTMLLGTRVYIREVFTSNIVLVEGGPATPERRLLTDQQSLAVDLSRPFLENLRARLGWSSLIYSDKKTTGGLSSTSTHAAAAGVDFLPGAHLDVSPMIGYRWDNQGNIRDEGLHYSLGVRARDIHVDGYQIRGEGEYHEDRLSPRTLEGHILRAGVQKNFEGRTRDSLSFGLARNRREFHTNAGGVRGIDSRLEQVFSFSNILDYEMSRRFLSTVSISVLGRRLERDSRLLEDPAPAAFGNEIDEFRLETLVQIAYGHDRTRGFLRLQYSERNESHAATLKGSAPPELQQQLSQRSAQERSKNNLARRTIAAGSLELPLSGSDEIAIAGSTGILRYDTPSVENTEDRDELVAALALVTRHRLHPSLEVHIALEGNLSHTVYLLGARSSSNNYNRVLRLSPRTIFRPTRSFVTVNTFEVLANYTVYDFEEQAALVRSFSYRQFSWMDSTAVELTGRVGLDFLGYLKLYERGQLRWAEFTERTENAFVDFSYAVQARCSPSAGLLLAVGIRSFSQTRYSYADGEKRFDSTLRSIGPTCNIQWDAARYGMISLSGWYEHRTQTGGTARSLPNMSMNIQLTL